MQNQTDKYCNKCIYKPVRSKQRSNVLESDQIGWPLKHDEYNQYLKTNHLTVSSEVAKKSSNKDFCKSSEIENKCLVNKTRIQETVISALQYIRASCPVKVFWLIAGWHCFSFNPKAVGVARNRGLEQNTNCSSLSGSNAEAICWLVSEDKEVEKVNVYLVIGSIYYTVTW